MGKKRILFIGEASFLSTGFATYYRELIPRLVATGKYEIAELGSYASQTDERIQSFIAGRWKFYGVLPTTQEENQVYHKPSPHPRTKGQLTNQFGEYRLNAVLAEFKPDIVVDIRDWWMLEFQERSIFRSWFKWVIMPTVDAEPQQEEWIQTYENAEVVLAYSDYGVHTLRQQSSLGNMGRRKMKIYPHPMRPGVDLETFKPMDKAEVRDLWNMNANYPVIGTVMRNQSRKLYPDLIDAFSMMKKKYKGHPAADESILMIHSSWPDNMHSYDYPRHIMRLETLDFMPAYNKGIRGSILQSLYCQTCHEPSWTYAMNLWGKPIQEGRIKLPCALCGAVDASPPSTGGGFNREQLAQLYNLFDVYAQCSICEGDGMPIQEAKACGVPTLVTDYTAMREKGRFPNYSHFEEMGITESNYSCHHGGEVIETERYYYEPETSCMRAHPSRDDLADKMFGLISNKERRSSMADQARLSAETNYDATSLFEKWDEVFDKIKILDRSKTWDSPIEVVDKIQGAPIPDGLSDEQYVDWLYTDILKYPAVDTNGAKVWVQHLAQGVTREQLMQQFISIGNQQSDHSKLRDQVRAQYTQFASKGEKQANRHSLELV
jgi:glycosyltransferase involved in cell wall biosynthesis